MKQTVSVPKVPGNCKIVQKTGNLYRIKNKEEKNRKYMTDWGYVANLVWGEKVQGNKYRVQNWLGFWGLVDWIDIFLVCSTKAFIGTEIYLSFSLLVWHPQQEQLHFEPKLFQQSPLWIILLTIQEAWYVGLRVTLCYHCLFRSQCSVYKRPCQAHILGSWLTSSVLFCWSSQKHTICWLVGQWLPMCI